MHSKTGLAILITALLLALPAASAEWKGRGWYEPDTALDVEGGYMWLDAAQDTDQIVKRIYFNVWADMGLATSVNPNSATLGSTALAYPTQMHALLGVWRDCNGDGFIGQPEGLFQWYPAQLLLRQDICPADPQPYGRPGQQVDLVHNDGVWVREFLQIGNERPPTGNDDANEFTITDNSSKIWGDWGLPADAPLQTCAVTPIPSGTIQRTGGALRYADCHAAWRVTGTVTLLAQATGQHQLRFDDTPRRPDHSQSDLNQANPWGQEGDASYAYAFDCSRAPIAVNDPTGASHQHVRVDDPRNGSDELDREYWVNLTDRDHNRNVTNNPRAPTTNVAGASPAGTVNETEEGALGDCDRSDGNGSTGNVYPIVESEHEGNQGPRSKSDFFFTYVDGGDGACALPTQAATCTPAVPQITGAGGQALYSVRWTGAWYGDPGYVASRNPYVNRDTLEPWGASHATFYAYVSNGMGDLPPTAVAGTYGSDHCLGTTPRDPVNPTWDCTGATWWLNADGTPSYDLDGDGFDARAMPGEPYKLMDVDCYDFAPTRGVEGPFTMVGEHRCDRPAGSG